MASQEHSGIPGYEGDSLTELRPNVWRIASPGSGGHAYLVNDRERRVLIDSGLAQDVEHLTSQLAVLNLHPADIHMVINTHEHYDHTGGNRHFQDTALIAAHRFAATKIEMLDEYVTHAKESGFDMEGFRVHLWLENGTLIVTGDYRFEIVHTPGHTSGCICIYEPQQHFMFTGDTLVAGGDLPPVLESGSGSDYVNSLERLNTLKLSSIFPGHGYDSDEPGSDLEKAIMRARERLEAYRNSIQPGQRRRMRVVANTEDTSQ